MTLLLAPRIFNNLFIPSLNTPNLRIKLLVAAIVRKTIEALPDFDVAKLQNINQYERAMLILSYLGHAYVWGEKNAPCRPYRHPCKTMAQFAKKLERPPVPSCTLTNCKRLDLQGPVDLGNIVLIQKFVVGLTKTGSNPSSQIGIIAQITTSATKPICNQYQ